MKVKSHEIFRKGSKQILAPLEMSFPEQKHQRRDDERPPPPPYSQQRQPQQQQNGYLQDQSYHGQDRQSFYAREPPAHHDSSIHTLTYPPPSYSGLPTQESIPLPRHPASYSSRPVPFHSQQSVQPRYSQQQYFAHPRQYQKGYSPRVDLSHQQYQFHPGVAQLGAAHPGTAQYPPQGQPQQQYSAQPGVPLQQYPSQSGPYAYYTPGQPAQQIVYVPQYPPPPRAAQDSPMARPGRRPRENEEEDDPEGWQGFGDKHVRRVFVRKVYILLMLQLLFTTGIIALFVFEPHVKHFVRTNNYLYWVSLAVFAGVYIGLCCFQSVRRKFPINVIVLIIFTLAMSYMLGTISSFHQTEAVFMAVGICAVVCLAVSVFSFYTKFDFTKCGGILCILLIILILFGLIAIFVPSRTMTMIYAGTGAVVFTLFLAYDTQMLMGGKTVEISPEEYVFAAVQIYVDVVNIFIFLLMLLGQPD